MDHIHNESDRDGETDRMPGPCSTGSPPHQQPDQRSASTESQYRTIAQQMQSEAAKAKEPNARCEDLCLGAVECSATEILNAFLSWFHKRKKKNRSTFDTYRSALLWTFRYGIFRHLPDALDCHQKLSLIRWHEPFAGKTRRDPKRPISMPMADLNRIIDMLLTHKKANGLGARTQEWLLAALATGLRPGEWEFAELRPVDEPSTQMKYMLVVKNSKIKAAAPAVRQIEAARLQFPGTSINTVYDVEDLGFFLDAPKVPEYRTIPLTGYDAQWVRAHLESIRTHLAEGKPFSEYYDQCRKCFARACEYAFKGKKRYTLYVLRHQFAANAKGKYSREEVAELMGHGDIASASKYYAAKRRGHRSKGQIDGNTQSAQMKQTQEYPAFRGG